MPSVCADPGKKKSTGKALFFHILKLAVAVALIYWVVKDIDLQAVSAIPRSRLLAAWGACFCMILLQTSFTALRWKLLLEAQDLSISFFRSFSLTLQGMFFSLCLPGGAVGGDVVKAAVLAKETREGRKLEGVTSIFADRLSGMIALFGLTLLLTLLSLKKILTFSGELKAALLTLSLFCGAGIAAAFFLLFHDLILRISFIRAMVEWADRIVKGKLIRVLSSVDIYRKKWKVFLLSFVMGITVIHPFLLLGLYFAALILTGSDQDFMGVALASGHGNVASCIPGSVGGLGVRDKVMQLLLESAGLLKSDAALSPLIYSLSYAAISLTGAIFFLGDSFRKKEERKK